MMNERTALVPVDQRQVDFHGDDLVAVLVEEAGQRRIYVPLRPICTYLGLNWSGQWERTHNDDVLAEELRSVWVTQTERGARAMECLPLDFLSGWLFGVQAKRVKAELQAKIKQYRRECYRVLGNAFQGEALTVVQQAGIAVTTDPRVVEIAAQIETLTAQITFLQEHMAAILAAGERIERLSSQLEQATGLLHTLIGGQEQLTAHQATTDQRLAKIDARTQQLSPASQRQAQAFIDHMVKLSKRGPHPLDYSDIYGAVKRHFNVGSYSQVADDRKDDLLQFLHQLLRQATGGELPEQGTLFG